MIIKGYEGLCPSTRKGTFEKVPLTLKTFENGAKYPPPRQRCCLTIEKAKSPTDASIVGDFAF